MSHRVIIGLSVLVFIPAASACTPPTWDEITRSIETNRAAVVNLQIRYERTVRAYTDETMTRTADRLTVYDLAKHNEMWSIGLQTFARGVRDDGPTLERRGWFDGTRSIGMIPGQTLPDGTAKPNSYLISPGMQPTILTTNLLGNYLTAAWGEYETPLDRELADPAWTTRDIASVTLNDAPVYRVTLERTSATDGLRRVFFLSPDHAWLPIRSEAHVRTATADWRRLHVRTYSDWTLLETGAWLPRRIELRDPDNAADPTYDLLQIIDLDQTALAAAAFTDVIAGPALITDDQSRRNYAINISGSEVPTASIRPQSTPTQVAVKPNLVPVTATFACLGILALAGARARALPRRTPN